jgi:hypothetical protein
MDKMDKIINESLNKLDKYIIEQAPAEQPQQQVPPDQQQQQVPPDQQQQEVPPDQQQQEQPAYDEQGQLQQPPAEMAPGMDPNMMQDPNMMGMDPGNPNPEIQKLDVDAVAADANNIHISQDDEDDQEDEEEESV